MSLGSLKFLRGMGSKGVRARALRESSREVVAWQR